MELHGKVAVVTGASSGLGEAAAKRLAAEGMKVVAVARRAERLQALAEHSPRIEPYAADVTRDDDVDGLATAVAERHGACHLLLNNAGQGGGQRMREPADRAGIAEVMDVNLFGAVRTMTAFASLLEASAPSQVINLASVAGKLGVLNPAYTASKFALVGLTEAVGPDWDARGVRVTQLNPGFIRTEGFPQEQLLASPLTRWTVGEPELVADAVVDAVRRRSYERTVPRWYRVAVVARHVAAPVVRAAMRRM